MHFVESTEANLIVSATPPIKYVNETINDIVEDVIIVRDEIEEFVDGKSIGTFIYDKGIILVFKDHQIGIELYSWMARRGKQGVYHLYGGCDYGRFGMCESNLCQDYERAGFRKRDWVD